MGSSTGGPVFQAVMDLGLRDVGVENDARRHATFIRKTALQIMAVTLSFTAMAISFGAPPLIAAALLPAAMLVLIVRSTGRAPLAVVKAGAEGANRMSRLLFAPVVLVGLVAALSGQALLVAMAVLFAIPVVIVHRTRGRVPEVLARVRGLLAHDERVLGDAAGTAVGKRGFHDAFRIVVATDRRLLVVPSAASDEFPLVDAPYERVSRFDIEWKYRGHLGEMSLDVSRGEGAPPESHVITSMGPANLVSVASALRAHDVQAVDPVAVDQAERGWEEARRRAGQDAGESESDDRDFGRSPRLPAFERGLWMLLRLSAAALYVNSFGVGLGPSRDPAVAVLLVLPIVCGICGYIAGDKRAFGYLIPLNLLVSPTFFFGDTADVLSLMLTLSTLAAAGLGAGLLLHRAKRGRPPAPASPPPPKPPRGSVQEVLSGPGLIRLTGIVLAGITTLAIAGAAAGFELSMVRLAIEEMRYEQLPVDGRSNLTGDSARFTYTTGPDLRELVTDHAPEGAPTDGARWELRSRFTKGYNVVSLATYEFEPRLGNRGAVERFVAKKDAEHSYLAGRDVSHTERVVDGRRGYVWDHGSASGRWYYAAWFPRASRTVRVECIAKQQEDRFKRLCAEAMRTLEIR